VSFAITPFVILLMLAPQRLEYTLCNCLAVLNCTLSEFLPESNDRCKVITAIPIPQISLSGNAPISGRVVAIPSCSMAILLYFLRSLKLLATVDVALPQNASRFARLIATSKSLSLTRSCPGLYPLMFLKWHKSH
jgi:hypothetical protein